MLVVDWFKFSNALTDRQLVARENNETRIKKAFFFLGGCTKLLFLTKKVYKEKVRKWSLGLRHRWSFEKKCHRKNTSTKQ